MGRSKRRRAKASRPAQAGKRDHLDAAVRGLFAAWGRQGGKTGASKLSPEERSARARRAVMARWAKAKVK